MAVVLATTGDDEAAPPSSSPSSAPGAGRAPDPSAEDVRPSPRADATTPLGTPPSVPDAGTYAFRQVQPGSDDPVTWDPCRPIAVVVARASDAPDDAGELLDEALSDVSAATGLAFDLEGPTDEVPAPDGERPLVQPDRYGDRWAPVLVAWTDPGAVPALEGDVGGLGGSTAVRSDDGTEVYVSGTLLLDGPQMEESLRVVGGRDQVRSVLLHELAHVVGLAHVEDRGELMHPEGQPGASGYGPGDRAGLARLGAGPCVPGL